CICLALSVTLGATLQALGSSMPSIHGGQAVLPVPVVSWQRPCRRPPRRADDSLADSTALLATLLQRRGYVALSLQPVVASDTQSRFWVRGSVGTTPLNLLIDSGAEGTIHIRGADADALGIRGSPTDSITTVNGKVSTDTGRVRQFTLGTMRFADQPVIIPRVKNRSNALAITFLSTHAAILDYGHAMLYVQLVRQNSLPELATWMTQHHYTLIPLGRMKGDTTVVVVRAAVGSASVLLFLDTGATGTVTLDQSCAEKLAVHDRLTLTLGPVRLDALPFDTYDFSQLNARLQHRGLPHVDGVLEADVLRAHAAILDLGQDMLYLR
ncbi:MAG TPA: retropepsin-like aspartic protease, partial [Gemmatimonadaceae bacterium]|nr:retropepsin-like aspartic protease [Gemmatimonadaceae bacterium]